MAWLRDPKCPRPPAWAPVAVRAAPGLAAAHRRRAARPPARRRLRGGAHGQPEAAGRRPLAAAGLPPSGTGQNREPAETGRIRVLAAALRLVLVRAVMVRRVIARNAPRGPRPPIGRAGHRRQIAAAILPHVARESTAEQHVPPRLTEAPVPAGPRLAMETAEARVPPQGTGSPVPHVRRPVTVPAVPDVPLQPTGPAIPAGPRLAMQTAQARVRPQGTGSPAPHVRRPVTVPAVPGVLQRPMTSVVPAGRLMLAPARARAPGPSAGIGRSAPASGQPGQGPASIEGRGRVPQRAESGEAPPAADAGPGMRLRAVRRARIAHEAATGRRNAGRATRPGPGLTRSQAEVPGSRAPTEKAPRAGRRTAVVSASRTPSPRSNSILTHVPS